MTLALAIDLGGTKIEGALVDADGAIIEGSRHRTPTGAGAATDLTVLERGLTEVIDGCRAHPRWNEVVAAGVGAAVFVVSTGVGGGIVSDGRLVAGGSGNAGHLGQILVADVDGEPAASTLEQRASGPHTVAWARAQGWAGTTGEELAVSYRAGEDVAVAAVARSAHAVGVGLTSAATLLDLELAVVGGGFSFVADDYPDRIERVVRDSAVNAYAGRLKVVRAGLGGDAPLIGAGALVHRADLL